MKDERIDRDTMYLEMCYIMSQRGGCLRAFVACIITRDNRILSSGYNGPPKGQEPCNKTNCNLEESCKRAVHAETNAIAFAAKNGIILNGATLYCIYAPCLSCAQLIVPTGITRVVYDKEYRSEEGLKFLEKAGVLVEKRYCKILEGLDFPTK